MRGAAENAFLGTQLPITEYMLPSTKYESNKYGSDVNARRCSPSPSTSQRCLLQLNVKTPTPGGKGVAATTSIISVPQNRTVQPGSLTNTAATAVKTAMFLTKLKSSLGRLPNVRIMKGVNANAIECPKLKT